MSRCARSPIYSTRRRPIAAAGGSTKTGATGTPISMPAHASLTAQGPEADAVKERHAVALSGEFAQRGCRARAGSAGRTFWSCCRGPYLLQDSMATGETGSLPVWLLHEPLGRRRPYPSLAVNILPLHLTAVSESLGDFLNRVVRVLRQQRRHGRYRIEQIAADQRGLAQGTRFLFSPLINAFDSPTFGLSRHAADSRQRPGDGFDLTIAGAVTVRRCQPRCRPRSGRPGGVRPASA
ncbi:hypothetical protein DSL92_07720 [Billgrantia gudaonensis]|uniref:Condensation domain-containing protein n=1 Tax=Billgrantia gudaonensis TaxID=376427 RepID=A0A432JHW8_9GAMM|nr:hypothetical protein DSL92_07720 [Halomonas gudaonensis]